MTGLDLVTDVLRELNVIGAADTPSAEDAALVLNRMGRVIEALNLDPAGAYCHTLTTFTLTASLNPHTIGPSGATWTATRPLRIDAANLIIGDARYPLTVHHDSNRVNLADPTVTGDPIELDYEPANPNGSIYFYPVPSTANSVELLVRLALSAITLAGTVTVPPGYHDAIVMTTAEKCLTAFSVSDGAVVGMVRDGARKARASVKSNNTRIPHLTTRDSGMPGGTVGGKTDLTSLTR